MELIKELLPGCFLLKPIRFEDKRGCFVKTYHQSLLAELGINMEIREEFFSISHKDVLRGMHFQLPPHAHDKLVYCPQGAVLDVLLDLRRGDGYGRVASAQLSGENSQMMFIPKGIAHGFVAMTDHALMLYKTSTTYSPDSDSGILWDSFGFDWGINLPCLSDRDKQHTSFAILSTPF